MKRTTIKIVKGIAFITISFLLLPFMASAQGKNDTVKGVPYFIKVGEGTGGIKLGVSTIADVEKIFGKGKVRKGKSKRDGKVYTNKVISYKKQGLKFFAINAPDTATVIYSIEVAMAGARTEKDIVIGSSSQADVIKAYGEPSYKSPTSISYDTQGMVFEFANGVLEKVLISQRK